jgi:type II secretory pathway pseudopilin PulG
VLAVLVALGAALLPVWQAYQSDVLQLLQTKE